MNKDGASGDAMDCGHKERKQNRAELLRMGVVVVVVVEHDEQKCLTRSLI